MAHVAPKTKVELMFGILALLYVLSIPLNNSFEVLALHRGELGWREWAVPLTPIYIKVMKDIFLIFSVIFMFYRLSTSQRIFRSLVSNKDFFLVHIMLVTLLISVFVSLIRGVPADVIGYGIRAYWVLIFVYVGYVFFTFDLTQYHRIFKYLLCLHFLLQVVQYLNELGLPVFGEERNPGMFITPTNAGAFSLLCIYIFDRVNNLKFLLLASVSVVLTASSISLIGLCLFIFIKMYKRYGNVIFKNVMIVLFIVVSVVVFLNFEEFTGRGEAASDSLMNRIYIIDTALEDVESLFLGFGLGYATSQAVMLDLPFSFIADNTFIGAVINMGVASSVLILLIILNFFYVLRANVLCIILLLFSMVSNVFELSPVIQLMLVQIGAELHRREAYA